MANYKIYNVTLSDIEDVPREELNEGRLETLLHGYSSFEEVLRSSSDPITLDGSKKPYQITEGRHRVYLARQKNHSSVPVRVFHDKEKVRRYLNGQAHKSIHDQFNNTDDFANEQAFVNHANSMFNGHVTFWVTDLNVRQEANKRICSWKMNCQIGDEARADLSLLGIGIKGCLLD